MGLELVSSGKNPPEEINVIIEIPKDSEPVKYEVDKETGAIFVDRVLSTPMRYPCNYGYVPNTLCGDGDPADVLVVLPLPLVPGSVVRCRPVGVLKMSDEAGSDEKILAVPVSKIFSGYATSRTSARCPATGWSASATSSSTTRTWKRASGSSSKAGAAPRKPSAFWCRRTKTTSPSRADPLRCRLSAPPPAASLPPGSRFIRPGHDLVRALGYIGGQIFRSANLTAGRLP